MFVRLVSLALLFGFSTVYATPLSQAARGQIGVTLSYDSAYRALAYPGGDVPITTGVCSDVVIRAFRKLGVDLQKDVHQDMRQAFSLYPKNWGLKKPDRNIDHRRVPNLITYFTRQHWQVGAASPTPRYRAGDVVAWDLGGGLTHIGILSDRASPAGNPLVIHNIGRGVQEEDLLLHYRIIGHFRPVFAAS